MGSPIAPTGSIRPRPLRRSAMVVVVGILVWLFVTLPLASAAVAQADSGTDVAPRAQIVKIEPVIAPDGELWLRLHFEQPWGETPPFDLFSMFFGIGLASGQSQAAVGWEWHAGISTPLEDSATRATPGVFALDDGTVIVGTGLFPDSAVDLLIFMASWLDETSTTRQAGEFELSFDPSQFIFGDPFHIFGAPTYSLISNTPIAPTSPPTSSTPPPSTAPPATNPAPPSTESTPTATEAPVTPPVTDAPSDGTTSTLTGDGDQTDDSSSSTGLIVVLTASGLVVVGGGAYGLKRRNKTAQGTGSSPETPSTPVAPPAKDDPDQAITINLVSNGGTDSVHQYQVFRVVVELPPGQKNPPETIELEFSADSGDDETLTLAWEHNATGRPRYISQPITLDKGAMGEGAVTIFGMEFAVGGFNGLWIDNGENVTISYDGATTTFTAYDSWVQQGLGRAMATIAYWKTFWQTLLDELEGVEGPEAELARENARRGLKWAEKAENWMERDDALDPTKLAYVSRYAGLIGNWYEDERDALMDESQLGQRARDDALTNRSKIITENGYQIGLGLTRTIAEATFAGAMFTLITGQDIEGAKVTWDQRVLAAFELAGWAALAAGLDARGFGDIASGRGGRAASGAADVDSPDAVGPSAGGGRTVQPDTFDRPDNPWSRRADGAVDDYNPAGTLDEVTAPYNPTGSLDDVSAPGGPRRAPDQDAIDRTARQKNDQIPKVQSGYAKDVYVHGARRGAFVTDSGNAISVSGVARSIEDSAGWRPGMPVRLVSCHSANSGAAAALAARLKTTVRAPTHRVYIKPDGSFGFLGERRPKDPNFPDRHPGYFDAPADAGWIEFNEAGIEVGRVDQAGNFTPTGGG